MFKGLHLTHNDGDAMGCDVVLKTMIENVEFSTAYGIAGKADYAFRKLWDEYFELTSEVYPDDLVDEPSAIYFDLQDPNFRDHMENLKCIFITDISISTELAETLKLFVDLALENGFDITLWGIDHHPSNKMNEVSSLYVVKSSLYLPGIYEGAEKLNITEEDKTLVSAAYLLYVHLSENLSHFIGKEFSNPIPTKKKQLLHIFACMISEYDTWVWRNNPYALINYAIAKAAAFEIKFNHKSVPADIFKKVIDTIGMEKTVEMMIKFIQEAKDSMKKREICEMEVVPQFFKDIEKVMKLSEELTVEKFFDSSKLHIYDNPPMEEYVIATYISDNPNSNRICEEVYKRYNFVDIAMVIYPASCQIGLRSYKKDVNLTRFTSRRFNGGGHPSASGAHLSKEAILAIMDKMYFDTPNVFEYKSLKGIE